jgi:hypothetical protein
MFSLSMLLVLFVMYLIARDRFKLYQELVKGVFAKMGATNATDNG